MFDIRKIPIPTRLASRPKDWRGYPVPYFQAIPPTFAQDGKVDFRVKDPMTILNAMKNQLCGLCGQSIPRGGLMAFVGGPDEIEQRVFPDPPNHSPCARYAMLVCPFLRDVNYRPSTAEIEGTISDATRSGFRPKQVGIYFTDGYEICRVKGHPMLHWRPNKAVKIEWF